MKTLNELKKGTRVLLAYGEQFGDLAGCDSFSKYERMRYLGASYKPWEAELMDNFEERRKGEAGTIRLMKVFGWETETGDTYAHEVIAYKNDEGKWEETALTEEQIQMKKMTKYLN